MEKKYISKEELKLTFKTDKIKIKEDYFICSNEDFNNLSLAIAQIKLLIDISDIMIYKYEKRIYKNKDLAKEEEKEIFKELWEIYVSLKDTKKKLEFIEKRTGKLYREINSLYKYKKLESTEKALKILKIVLKKKKNIEDKRILLNYRILKLVKYIRKKPK